MSYPSATAFGWDDEEQFQKYECGEEALHHELKDP
jgi:hypothetical protein